MIKFEQEYLLWALLFIPALIALVWWSSLAKRKALARFGNQELVNKLNNLVNSSRVKLKYVLLISGASLILFALTGPQIGTKLVEVKREGLDVVVALDVSTSMMAEDIKPNRLERAKQEIRKFIDLLQGDRVGLVVFSGAAYPLCPLTLDYSAAKSFIGFVEPGVVSRPGTRLDEAIRVAKERFDRKERKHKVMVLITDGEEHEDEALEMAKSAAAEGIVVYTVGVGSIQGAPIPVLDPRGRRTDFKRDRSGQVITTKLDELTLEKIALETGGKYFRASGSSIELKKIYDDISAMEKKQLASRQFSQYEERYQFFLLPGILLLLIELVLPERKRIKKEWTGRFA